MTRRMDNPATSSGHGGNIHQLSRLNQHTTIVDFSANINPLGPPHWLRSTLSRSVTSSLHYPDPECYHLISAISDHCEINKEKIIPANGSTELLYLLPQLLSPKRAIIPVPAYIDYARVMELHNIEIIKVPLSPSKNFVLDVDELATIIEDQDLVVIGSPNNPTGAIIAQKSLLKLAESFPNTWFVIDEAFIDFLDDRPSVAGQSDNIITLNSLTKFYALPGLRLGYGTFPQTQAQGIRKYLPPWSVNTFAQNVGIKLFADIQYRRRSLQYNRELREDLADKLSHFNELHVFPSEVNYFLVKINSSLSATQLSQKLLQKGIAIRICENYDNLDDKYFRIAVRTAEENDLLIKSLGSIISSEKTAISHTPPKTPSLMIQGTSSDAGKSVIAAALCRILIQDGVRVAPFKAQNMSLNSFVTHDGLEMGRAQVVQAQAARLDPDVNMNPVLLKPNSDIGSQIIVHGKPVGNMSVTQYVDYKAEAWQKVCQSYDNLAAEYDALILEGAGSPGEVNLKHHDIVNMRMAKYAKSNVLLVGDIDRGGVYASFIGTMEVMEEWERRLVSGFLVNRFRGDATLLQPAHDYLLDFTGKPVLGTIPYITDLGIPEEDSVSFKAGKLQKNPPASEHVEICLINLPHISNFTDIEPFLDEPDVYLNIVNSVDQLIEPDAIILPGSKNVIGDLNYLKSSGLGEKITKFITKGVHTAGICGGYQILGNSISDPHGIESEKVVVSALGIMDIETILAPEKTLTRKEGTHLPSGTTIFGYEIHHGLSAGNHSPLLQFNDNSTCGLAHSSLPVWGAYLHGVFDSDSFRRWFIDNLREEKGLERLNRIVAPYNLELAFDTLAKVVRDSVEMDKIYQLLQL